MPNFPRTDTWMPRALLGVGLATVLLTGVGLLVPWYTKTSEREHARKDRVLSTVYQIRWLLDNRKLPEALDLLDRESTSLDRSTLDSLRQRYAELVIERDRLPIDPAAWERRMLPRLVRLIDSLEPVPTDSLVRLGTEADSCGARFPDLDVCRQAAVIAAIHTRRWSSLASIARRGLQRDPADPWARGARGVILLVGGDPVEAERWIPLVRVRSPFEVGSVSADALPRIHLATFWLPFRAALSSALHPVDGSFPPPGAPPLRGGGDLFRRLDHLELATRAWAILGDPDSTRCYGFLEEELIQTLGERLLGSPDWRRIELAKRIPEQPWRWMWERNRSSGAWSISWPERPQASCPPAAGTDGLVEACIDPTANLERSEDAFSAALWIAQGRTAASDSASETYHLRHAYHCPEGHPGSKPPFPGS